MELRTDSSATTELPRLLNITEVADTLGVNVRHVRRLVYERRIPFIKWGHLIRFDPDDVARWLDGHRTAGMALGPEVRQGTAGRR